jgi:hypothetical protein
MIEAVSDGVPASEPLQSVRRASSYPAFLSVARLYAAGLILLMAPVGVVSCSGQGAWFFLSAVGLVMAVLAGALAARGFRKLEQDLVGEKVTEIRSAATIAAFQDLIRKR